MQRTRRLAQFFLVLSICLLGMASLAAPKPPGTSPEVLKAADEEGKVLIYSTTDQAAAALVLKDFGQYRPKIVVDYNDMNSTEVYNRFISEAAAGAGTADLIWSSAMDLQIKLANDGYALEYKSAEAAALPSWAVWKNQAFGTTYEPIVFVYNKRLLKPEEVPQSHADLVKKLREAPERFKGKLTTYDVEKSGLGFLLITQDARIDPSFAEALKTYGKTGMKLYSSSGTMIERIASGEHLIGFNMIGSYALGKQKKDPSIGIVYPKDYTLVMSRVAFIPKAAKNKNAAKVFLDYLLSSRGQEAIAKASLFSIRPDVQGETTLSGLEKSLGASLKPIPVGPAILEYLEQSKRLAFLKQWQQAIGTK